MAKKKEVKPTVGRIVLFKDNEERIFPAIIVNVNEEGAVDLNVFTLDGPIVERIVEQGQGNISWDWMVFQKDQQKRTVENLSKKAVEKIIDDKLEEMAKNSEEIEEVAKPKTAKK